MGSQVFLTQQGSKLLRMLAEHKGPRAAVPHTPSFDKDMQGTQKPNFANSTTAGMLNQHAPCLLNPEGGWKAGGWQNLYFVPWKKLLGFISAGNLCWQQPNLMRVYSSWNAAWWDASVRARPGEGVGSPAQC